MSLLPPRKPRPLGRQRRRQRDDRLFIIATEDTYAPKQYVAAFSKARKEARDAGFHVAVSNPCFELWLLLHVADVALPLGAANSVEAQLRAALGGYSKTNVPAARLLPHVDVAVARAKNLDVGAGGWPQTVGTQVHLLVAELVR